MEPIRQKINSMRQDVDIADKLQSTFGRIPLPKGLNVANVNEKDIMPINVVQLVVPSLER